MRKTCWTTLVIAHPALISLAPGLVLAGAAEESPSGRYFPQHILCWRFPLCFSAQFLVKFQLLLQNINILATIISNPHQKLTSNLLIYWTLCFYTFRDNIKLICRPSFSWHIRQVEFVHSLQLLAYCNTLDEGNLQALWRQTCWVSHPVENHFP